MAKRQIEIEVDTVPVAVEEQAVLEPWKGGLITGIAGGVLAFILNEPSSAPMLAGEGFVGGTILTALLNIKIKRDIQKEEKINE